MSQQMFRTALPPAPSTGDASASERFTRALVALTRQVWSPECTFETAIAAICETAADALRIERVSVWSYEAADCRLRCLHAFDAASGLHAPVHALETLSLDGDDYVASLDDVRVLEVVDLASDAQMARSHLALRDYLQRHRIHGVLDAPAFVGGELQGVICLESILRVRAWSAAETTFAASMGDYVAMAFEIARRRRAEAEVEHLRLHDAATGLPNREYLTELIRQRLLMAPLRRDEVLAAVHVQVDVSGGVAWSAGAPTVDAVVGRIARLLRSLMGHDTELARTGSDGFTFLVSTNPSKRSVIRLAEAILATLESMDWQHVDVDPTVSVGIALADRQPGPDDAPALLQQGEEAAARARAAGRFGYAIYDAEHHAVLVEGLRFERALREGFANGEFELHYQPEFDARSGRWVAAESLLRWRVGDTLRVAGEFIGVLEPSRLMLDVGRWVLRQACQDAVAWPRNADGQEVTVRVNVSARQFDEPGLAEDVQAALEASGLDPARLSLELTETTLMRDVDRALELLRPLRDSGVQVAIDDFGTGYASLVYLKCFPVDALKIDGSFVQGMLDNKGDRAIVQAVVSLAAAFDIEVIAEGVETQAQQAALLAVGVQRMQGWLYGKAVPNGALCGVIGSRPGGPGLSADPMPAHAGRGVGPAA